LNGKSRAAQWSKVFGKALSVDDITQVTTTNSAFADDALAALSRLIGLTGGQSQLHYQDLLEDEAPLHRLHFTRQPSAPRAVPEGQAALRNYFDPDNSRMLLVYPASWPVPLLEEIQITWLMLSEGAGFNDRTLAIQVNGPDGLPKASYQTSDLATLQPRGRVVLHEVRSKQAAILRDRTLNHFAIASNVAIVQDDGQQTLDACRSYLEAWLRPLAEQAGEVRIRAEKRMTERAYVGKSQKTSPASEF
jgi:hypothetical protein